MSLDTIFNAKIDITRNAPDINDRDEYNNPKIKATLLAEAVPCWFEFSAFSPLGSFQSPERRELQIGRETVLIDARAVVPFEFFDGYDTFTIVLDATDQIVLVEHGGEPRVELYQILGPPARVEVPRGNGHTQLNLRRVTG